MDTQAHYITKIIAASTSPLVLEFHADNCLPCITQDDMLSAASAQPSFPARVVQINVDNGPEIAKRFHVTSVPSVVVLEGGRITAKYTGLIDPGSVIAAVEAA